MTTMKKDRCKIRLSSKKKYLYISKFFVWGRLVVVFLNSDELVELEVVHVSFLFGNNQWSPRRSSMRRLNPGDSPWSLLPPWGANISRPTWKQSTYSTSEHNSYFPFLSSQQHPCLVVSVSDPYRAFCADMVPWWRVRCHFDTTLHCSIEDMLY